jgi:hypothetical protein
MLQFDQSVLQLIFLKKKRKRKKKPPQNGKAEPNTTFGVYPPSYTS